MNLIWVRVDVRYCNVESSVELLVTINRVADHQCVVLRSKITDREKPNSARKLKTGAVCPIKSDDIT